MKVEHTVWKWHEDLNTQKLLHQLDSFLPSLFPLSLLPLPLLLPTLSFRIGNTFFKPNITLSRSKAGQIGDSSYLFVSSDL
jgi:hypothetical protein